MHSLVPRETNPPLKTKNTSVFPCETHCISTSFAKVTTVNTCNSTWQILLIFNFYLRKLVCLAVLFCGFRASHFRMTSCEISRPENGIESELETKDEKRSLFTRTIGRITGTPVNWPVKAWLGHCISMNAFQENRRNQRKVRKGFRNTIPKRWVLNPLKTSQQNVNLFNFSIYLLPLI